jgi:hypothetical protein
MLLSRGRDSLYGRDSLVVRAVTTTPVRLRDCHGLPVARQWYYLQSTLHTGTAHALAVAHCSGRFQRCCGAFEVSMLNHDILIKWSLI